MVGLEGLGGFENAVDAGDADVELLGDRLAGDAFGGEAANVGGLGPSGRLPALVLALALCLGEALSHQPFLLATTCPLAVKAFQEANGLPSRGTLDAGTWKVLISSASGPVLKLYTITDDDLAGPFSKQIPAGLAQMAELRGLSYRSPLARLAEKRANEIVMRPLTRQPDAR